MNLIRFNQNPSFSNLMENFEKSFEHNFVNSSASMPKVNVINEDKQYLVELAVPGMSKDDFAIKLESNKLIISSEQKEEKTKEDKKYTIKEYSFNSFTRSFFLPKNIKHDKVEADYKDGILSISLPKKETEAKLNREIKVA